MDLAVVVPMYNEEAGARHCVERILGELEALPCSSRLVAVDDGSTDATLAILRAAVADGLDLDVVASPANQGYGGALRTGAARAAELGASWALFMDSDLTNPPEHIGRFLAAMGPDVDVVKACRFPHGDAGTVPLKRRAFARVAAVLARTLGGGPHRDPTNGYRAVRVDRYLELPLADRGFSVIMEEQYWARRVGLRGVDVPTTLSARATGLRPSSFQYSRQQLWAYLRWPLRTAADRLRGVARGPATLRDRRRPAELVARGR
jgi:glycosyltransferase involved in cell wall biosynthesis